MTAREVAFVALFERSRELLKELEAQWGTPALDSWCTLVRDLVRGEEANGNEHPADR